MNTVLVYKNALLQTVITRLTVEIGGDKDCRGKTADVQVLLSSNLVEFFVFVFVFFKVTGPKKM